MDPDGSVKNPPTITMPCDKKHCNWRCNIDYGDLGMYILAGIALSFLAFLAFWFACIIWFHTVGAKSKSIAQQKQDQAVEQMHINACAKLNKQWVSGTLGSSGECQ